MRKLDLIIEGIRDEYMINLLEEGSVSELESLKTKKFLNENLNRIRKMLIEEGALDGVKQHLGNNWGKYLGGAGALGAGALAANHFMGDDVMPEGEAGVNQQAATYAENPGARVADAALQNAQSAGTQADQDVVLNGPSDADRAAALMARATEAPVNTAIQYPQGYPTNQ